MLAFGVTGNGKDKEARANLAEYDAIWRNPNTGQLRPYPTVEGTAAEEGPGIKVTGPTVEIDIDSLPIAP